MVVSWYFHKKTTSIIESLPKERKHLQQSILFIWVVSFFASITPLFLPVYLFLMPLLFIALMVTTCKQLRIILHRRRKTVTSINDQRVSQFRIQKGKNRLGNIVLGFLVINIVCTMLPYLALILNETPLQHRSDFQKYADFSSKLPFLKSLVESLGYFWMQKTSRRRVYQLIQQQIATCLQMLSYQ